MKHINKTSILFLFGCVFILFGTSDGSAAQKTASNYTPGNNLCYPSGKIKATKAPIFADGDISKITSYVNNIEVLCKCKLNDGSNASKRDKQKASYAYPDGQWVQLTFPNAAQCDKSGNNKWKTEERYCYGFTKDTYDEKTQEAIFNFTDNCWFWICKDGLVFSTDDKTKCVPKDGNLEYIEETYVDENGVTQTTDVYPITPCDTKTPVTVMLNGIKKIVPSNTRVNDVCVPTCQSDMASSIDTTDPTQFIIYLQK